MARASALSIKEKKQVRREKNKISQRGYRKRKMEEAEERDHLIQQLQRENQCLRENLPVSETLSFNDGNVNDLPFGNEFSWGDGGYPGNDERACSPSHDGDREIFLIPSDPIPTPADALAGLPGSTFPRPNLQPSLLTASPTISDYSSNSSYTQPMPSATWVTQSTSQGPGAFAPFTSTLQASVSGSSLFTNPPALSPQAHAVTRVLPPAHPVPMFQPLNPSIQQAQCLVTAANYLLVSALQHLQPTQQLEFPLFA